MEKSGHRSGTGGACALARKPSVASDRERRYPQGLYGSARATALAQVGARYDRNALIFADLSNDTKVCRAVARDLWAARDWRAY